MKFKLWANPKILNNPILQYKEKSIIGFKDSDWDGDLDDRKSTASFVFTLGSRPITWDCKKEISIALSSTEA